MPRDPHPVPRSLPPSPRYSPSISVMHFRIASSTLADLHSHRQIAGLQSSPPATAPPPSPLTATVASQSSQVSSITDHCRTGTSSPTRCKRRRPQIDRNAANNPALTIDLASQGGGSSSDGG
ncbi:hypothetical protein DAI22_02g246900 [Oryza sativa Japonica Group]|nr:hypothetical protein DAI22_02g246900 [Oryza sativa Japonica Group]